MLRNEVENKLLIIKCNAYFKEDVQLEDPQVFTIADEAETEDFGSNMVNFNNSNSSLKSL